MKNALKIVKNLMIYLISFNIFSKQIFCIFDSQQSPCILTKNIVINRTNMLLSTLSNFKSFFKGIYKMDPVLVKDNFIRLPKDNNDINLSHREELFSFDNNNSNTCLQERLDETNTQLQKEIANNKYLKNKINELHELLLSQSQDIEHIEANLKKVIGEKQELLNKIEQ